MNVFSYPARHDIRRSAVSRNWSAIYAILPVPNFIAHGTPRYLKNLRRIGRVAVSGANLGQVMKGRIVAISGTATLPDTRHSVA